MQFGQAASAVAADLSQLGLGFGLIGGLAVSARTEPRFTQDIDLAVAVADDQSAERAVHRLVGLGYSILALVEQEALDRIATVRLAVAHADWVADLLFASSGIEAEIVAAAEPLEVFRDVRLPVARVGHLIALKLLARDDEERPQDAADLRALLEVADGNDIEAARRAVELIEVLLRELVDGS